MSCSSCLCTLSLSAVRWVFFLASVFWVPACSSRSPGQHCHLGQPSREFSVFSSRLAAAGIARSCFSARMNSASLSLSAGCWVRFGSFGILAVFLGVRVRVPMALHAAVGLLWSSWSFLDSSCPLRVCPLRQRVSVLCLRVCLRQCGLLARPFNLRLRVWRPCPRVCLLLQRRLLTRQFLNQSTFLRVLLAAQSAARSFGPAISHHVESSFVLHFFLVLLTFPELFGSAVC